MFKLFARKIIKKTVGVVGMEDMISIINLLLQMINVTFVMLMYFKS